MKFLTSSWILPVSGPPLRNGRVGVSQGRIVWVGGRADPVPEPPLDLGPGLVLPGFVNSHCHLELSHLRGRIDPTRGFVDWVQQLVDARWTDEAPAVRSAALEAVAALEGSGVVAVGDVSNGLACLSALAESRLRAVVFYELIGWDPAVAPAILDAAGARIADLGGALADGRVEVRLAAHAPHSVSRALLRGLVERGGPAAIHLAESPAEVRFLATGAGEWRDFLERRGLGHVPFTPPAVSPVQYLASLGVLGPSLLAAHCVHVDAADRQALARSGTYVALCPRSNRNLDVGRAPVPEMLEAGVRLCLGTDSLASVQSLDLLAEMAALHAEFPSLDPRHILRMATLGGAEALGLRDLGTIEVGKRAALVHLAAESPPADPFDFLVSGEGRVRRVDTGVTVG